MPNIPRVNTAQVVGSGTLERGLMKSVPLCGPTMVKPGSISAEAEESAPTSVAMLTATVRLTL